MIEDRVVLAYGTPLGRASSAEERGPTPVTTLAVEEHGQADLITNAPSENERHLRREHHLADPERHDRNDVRSPDTRVNPVVRAQIDQLCGARDPGEQRLDQIALVGDDREDGAVMIGVGVDVEDAPALSERPADRSDD